MQKFNTTMPHVLFCLLKSWVPRIINFRKSLSHFLALLHLETVLFILPFNISGKLRFCEYFPFLLLKWLQTKANYVQNTKKRRKMNTLTHTYTDRQEANMKTETENGTFWLIDFFFNLIFILYRRCEKRETCWVIPFL